MRKAIGSFQNFQLFVNRLLESNYRHWKIVRKISPLAFRLPSAARCKSPLDCLQTAHEAEMPLVSGPR